MIVINAPGWQFTPFLNATTNLNLKWTLKMVQFFLLRVTFEKAWKIIHVGCHLVSQLDRLWNGETHAQVVRLYISNVEVRVWATHLFGGDWSHVFCLNFDPPIPKLLKLFLIPDPFKFFRKCISWISSHMLTISWNLFYPRLHDGLNVLWKQDATELAYTSASWLWN